MVFEIIKPENDKSYLIIQISEKSKFFSPSFRKIWDKLFKNGSRKSSGEQP